MTSGTDPIVEALRAVADVVVAIRDPWWLIGSAALLLHGLDPGPLGDVDLLASERDAAAILAARGIEPQPGVPNARFRSAVFGRWSVRGVTVETMGGFEVRGPHGWQPVWPASRELVLRHSIELFVPSVAELGALLRRFGRPKDLARAALLDQPGPIPRSAGPNAWGSSIDSG